MIRNALRLFFKGWHHLRRGVREFWRPPDRLVFDATSNGEMVVARIRLLVVVGFLLAVAAELGRDPARPGAKLAAVAAFVVAVASLVLYRYVRENRSDSRIGYVSSTLDVVLIGGVLVVVTVAGGPGVAQPARLGLPFFLAAVAATSLREDRRICVSTGLLAVVVQIGVAVFVALWRQSGAPVNGPLSTASLQSHTASAALLGCVAWVSASAVSRTQRLRLASARDPLTGLVARRLAEEMIQTELCRARRYKRKVSVALLDIDHFKSFNDRFGHTVGDEVLHLIAKMSQSVRVSDTVGRYGGEEFIFLFPETDGRGACIRCENIRSMIETSSVTVSIGVAEFPADGDDLPTLVDSADQRLYQAKNTGRNRVVGPDGQFTPE